MNVSLLLDAYKNAISDADVGNVIDIKIDSYSGCGHWCDGDPWSPSRCVSDDATSGDFHDRTRDDRRRAEAGVCNFIPSSCHTGVRVSVRMEKADQNQINNLKLDKLNNNFEENNNVKQEAKIQPTRPVHFPPSNRIENVERLEFSRSRELMSRLCATNPQFTASVLEDYIRPIFREGDVVLEVECGSNAAVM